MGQPIKASDRSRLSALGFLIVMGGLIALLVRLGLWQLDRQVWKDNLLDQQAKAIQTLPQPLPQAPQEVQPYQIYQLQGGESSAKTALLPGSSLNVQALEPASPHRVGRQTYRWWRSGAGVAFLLQEPWELGDGAQKPSSQRTSQLPDSLIPKFVRFLPAHQRRWWEGDVYEVAPGLSSNLDIPAAATIDGVSIGRVTQFYAVPADPHKRFVPPPLPNKHGGYAITWFSLACAMIVLTLARLWGLRASLF